MMKKAIAIVGVALVCGAGSVHAEGFSAGPKVGVFLPEHGESSVLYGVEARKDVAPRFTAGLAVMAGELRVDGMVRDVVRIPGKSITVQPEPITVTPEPVTVECKIGCVTVCKKTVMPEPVTVTPEPVTVQQEDTYQVRERKVRRRADVVLAMAQGAYRIRGPVWVKGGIGVASIDGKGSLALSAGAGVAVPVSERVEVSASADYLHMDAADGVMLSAGLQYRF